MFLPSDISLSENKIILCDDVITTGSTMNECARILKSMGADYITAVAPATTILNNTNAWKLFYIMLKYYFDDYKQRW